MNSPQQSWNLPSLDQIASAIRTPMAGVLGLLDLALEQSEHRSAIEHIQAARHSTERLVWQLSVLADMLQAQRGGLSPRPERVDVQAKLRRVSSAWISEATRRGLGFTIQIEQGTPATITVDRQRLRQVLDVLMGDAFRRAHDGVVTLRVSGASDWIAFAILIDSRGRRPLAFGGHRLAVDSPTQGSVSGQTEGDGSDLDLSLIRVVVDFIGAVLVLGDESEADDVFARLQLELADPASEFLSAQRQDLTVAVHTPAIEGHARILVVDDHPVNRLLARRILESADFQVVEAVDGLDAMEHLQQSAFDLVLMDCHMPVLDGVEATRYWRKHEEQMGYPKPLPILALTAFTADTQKDACLRAGMNDFLGKPYTAAELLAYVQRHLVLPVAEGVDFPPQRQAEPTLVPLVSESTSASTALLKSGVLDALQDALGLDEVRQIVMLFVEQYAQVIEDLREAMRAEDRASLARTAHSLKGSAGNLGFGQLSDAAQNLERTARDTQQTEKGVQQAYEMVLESGAETLAEIYRLGLAE